MNKLIAILLALIMVFTLAACGETAPEATEPETTAPTQPPATEPPASQPSASESPELKVGLSMPTRDLPRWKQDGENLKKALEELGCEAELAFGENEVETQITQIESMIESGCRVLIIAAIEGTSLGTVLAEAKQRDIAVISYDRLIMCTPDVDYYVTFDNSAVGGVQGQFIVDALDLEHNPGPFNLEIVQGDPGDNNAFVFYWSAMQVLQPYLDSGKLRVLSGQVEAAQCATSNWDRDKAQDRMENILSIYYQDQPLHAVLCANDSTAQGVVNALAASYLGETYPVITGQDCDLVSVANIRAGTQSMSVFKDTQVLVDQAARMAAAILQGQTPEVNNITDYDNASCVVPAYLCPPTVVTAENYWECLLGSGYYSEADLAG